MARAVNNGGAWKCRRDQPEVFEVVRQFIGHARRAPIDIGERIEISAGSRFDRVRSKPSNQGPVVGLDTDVAGQAFDNSRHGEEFAAARDVRVAGQDLLDKARARAGHADDKYRPVRRRLAQP